jgi:16S rRNA (guanine(966)-N(2))-methyltransferase RsmD
MKLRIVSGTLRGRIIRFPDTDIAFRPTLERTRQSIADMVSGDLHGARTADLCAGSGAFGFEMISRGAASVDFIEHNRARSVLIREHATQFGVLDRCRFIVQDAATFVRTCTARYDIIFFDPPYDDGAMPRLVPSLVGLLAPYGVLLYQRRRRAGEVPDQPAALAPERVKTFGDTVVECYRSPDRATTPE